MLYVCLVARIDKSDSSYGGTFDDVWLGTQLHDWLLVLPLTDARLVSKELQAIRPQYIAVSLHEISSLAYCQARSGIRIVEVLWADTLSRHRHSPNGSSS